MIALNTPKTRMRVAVGALLFVAFLMGFIAGEMREMGWLFGSKYETRKTDATFER